MARSGKNQSKLWIIFASLGGFLVLSGAIAFVALRRPNQFANLPAFPVENYMEGKSLWSREDYKVEGRVDNVIQRSAAGNILLVSIQPAGFDLRLPVLIEEKEGRVPIQREQNLILRVSVGTASQILCKLYEPK